jgi:hypothetical protein
MNAYDGGINGAYRQGFVDALRGAAGGVTAPEIARGLAADATMRRGRAYWLGAARGLRQSDREGNAMAPKGWTRTPYGYVKGNARIDDNGGGLGPAKGSGRWAVTWAGWWVANVDTLAEAKALADRQAERAS